jgi:hypothetical protein
MVKGGRKTPPFFSPFLSTKRIKNITGFLAIRKWYRFFSLVFFTIFDIMLWRKRRNTGENVKHSQKVNICTLWGLYN